MPRLNIPVTSLMRRCSSAVLSSFESDAAILLEVVVEEEEDGVAVVVLVLGLGDTGALAGLSEALNDFLNMFNREGEVIFGGGVGRLVDDDSMTEGLERAWSMATGVGSAAMTDGSADESSVVVALSSSSSSSPSSSASLSLGVCKRSR